MSQEIYNAIEHQVGISAYLSSKEEHAGFAAVLKARISDFVVHEVNRQGIMARLEHLEPPPSTEETGTPLPLKKKQKLDLSTWHIEAQTALVQWVPITIAEQVLTMLQHWEASSKDNNKDDSTSNTTTTNTTPHFVMLPKLEDKDARRAVHTWIHSDLSHVALADTHDGCIRIWHKRFEKEMPTFGKFDRGNNGKPHKKAWPKDRPDFLQFVLYKENIDTGTATKDIIQRIHGKQVRMGYAGMKDKRGVTTQFCTLFQRHVEEITSFNKTRKHTGGGGGGNSNYGNVSVIRVGNFQYVDKELRLGSLTGNRFDIVLRNVCVDVPTTAVDSAELSTMLSPKETILKAAQALRDNGFINYFGMQRFGRDQDTHKTGIAVLTGNYEEACRIIMKPKPHEPPQVVKARTKWAERFQVKGDKAQVEKTCAAAVVRDMGRFMTCEVAILNSLKHRPLDYKRAFGTIPKHVRSMFLHAIQSLVFNRVASHRIETLGKQVLVGDLVLVEDRDEQDGGSGTSGRQGKEVHLVTSEDKEKDKYELTDVVLPLVGTKVKYPENETGALFVSILTEIGLKKEDFSNIQDREISLGGDYRKLICKPTDVDFEVVEYSDPLQPLLQTDLMKLDRIEIKENQKDDTNNLLGLVVGFTLPPSSYATICLRELMKRPTSVDYQRALQLSGPCEGKFDLNQGTLESRETIIGDNVTPTEILP